MIFTKDMKIPVKYKTRDGSIATIVKISENEDTMVCDIDGRHFFYWLNGNIKDNSEDDELKNYDLVELYDEKFREIN